MATSRRYFHRQDLDDPRTFTNCARFSRNHDYPLTYDEAPWRTWPELTVKITNLHFALTTYDVYHILSKFGNIERIDFSYEGEAGRYKNAFVTFSPPPSLPLWEGRNRIDFSCYERKISCHAGVELRDPKRSYFQSIKNVQCKYPELMEVRASSITFGTMYQPDIMMSTFKLEKEFISLRLNLRQRQLIMQFTMTLRYSHSDKGEDNDAKRRRKTESTHVRHYRAIIPIQQLTRILEIDSNTNTKVLVIPLGLPPVYLRKLDNLEGTHTEKNHWQDKMAWVRQTEIRGIDYNRDNAPIALQRPTQLLDIGRWSTFRLTFDKASSKGATYKLIRQALVEYNIDFIIPQKFDIIQRPDESLWTWIGSPLDKFSSGAEMLNFMASGLPELSWKVKYQLEACISQDCLNEYNISQNFLGKIAQMPEKRALELLEHASQTKRRYFNPEDIFRLKAPRSISSLKLPPYCCLTRAVNVTPTTMYISSPTVETSNRILRKYAEYGERFLRVRFSDEKTKGQVRSSDTGENDAVFTRFYRCLKDGIIIGGRHFEFLACGNSQFRERGAYFFARTPNLSAAIIRQNMGNFDRIRTASKFASRLGLAFSTTRSTQACKFQIIRIPDVVKGGYVFTDGVGKISIFLAKLITNELGYPILNWNPISVFQFRLGGMKGILAVDPTIGGREVHIRDSQTKFPADCEGLEIIRCGVFTAAYLNRQIILVLQSLGLPDSVFLERIKLEMDEINAAMSDFDLAVSKLTSQVDPNQMTVAIANILNNGFMAAQEPFAMTILSLWRVHSMRNLKEKARLVINKAAFLFGCTDETQTLMGYHKDLNVNKLKTREDQMDALPEIFVQIDRNGNGKYEVITGLCIVGRNPSLHPGDIRVVRAVDAPALYHIKNAIVFPQTGDRDIPSMCSGGDLDGDDFYVIWDQTFIPPQWNEQPMDFSSVATTEKIGPVTIDDVAIFFVNYMKRDSLKLIAVAHMAQADQLPGGVRNPKCIELAHLHSLAVDYPKSGVPVTMINRLRPRRFPHFLPNRFRPQEQIYRSTGLLGKMYDAVESVDFKPLRQLPFDERILAAYPRDQELENRALAIKEDYDAALQRIMSQHAIETEFEVWTTFVLKHAGLTNDYSFHEEIGRLARSLRAQFQSVCYEEAGGKDFGRLAPLVAAMYRVTSDETINYNKKCQEMEGLRDSLLYIGVDTELEGYPFISCPWIFYPELGRIAREFDLKKSNMSWVREPIFNSIGESMSIVGEIGSIANDDCLSLSPAPRNRLAHTFTAEEDSVMLLDDIAAVKEQSTAKSSIVNEDSTHISKGSFNVEMMIDELWNSNEPSDLEEHSTNSLYPSFSTSLIDLESRDLAHGPPQNDAYVDGRVCGLEVTFDDSNVDDEAHCDRWAKFSSALDDDD